jgi:hypothetical protein
MSTASKTHLSSWTAIRVVKADGLARVYNLDRSGRLNPTDVPRNSRRTLTDRTKPRTTFEAVAMPPIMVMDLDDTFSPEFSRTDWDMPAEITDMPIADLPMFKEIGEDFDWH